MRCQRKSGHRLTEPGSPPCGGPQSGRLPAAVCPQHLDLEAVYRVELPFVLSCSRAQGVRSFDQSDVANEVFLRALRARPGTIDLDHSRPWLKPTTTNVAKELRRKAVRPEDPLLCEPAGTLQPDELLQQAEENARCRLALERLEPGRRRVFELSTLDELGGPGIARSTGLSLNTVYSMVRLAKKDLAREIRILRRLPGATASGPPPGRVAAKATDDAVDPDLGNPLKSGPLSDSRRRP
jgi:RNA polymerase sigma factor (sigma-70 family)